MNWKQLMQIMKETEIGIDRAGILANKLIADGFIIERGGEPRKDSYVVRVLGIIAYGPRIIGISVAVNTACVRGNIYAESLPLSREEDGELHITSIEQYPYYHDHPKFYDNYEELKEHLMYATGKIPMPKKYRDSYDEFPSISDDEIYEESDKEEVEKVETVEYDEDT